MSAENRTTLLDLPVEIITRIIKDVDGASVYERRKGRLLSGIAPTCHLFRHLVESILFGELDLRSSEATYGLSEEDLEIQLKNQHSDACLDEFIRLFEESLTSALRKTSLRVLYYPLRWSMPELGSNDDDDDDDEDKVYTLEQVAVPSKEFSSKTQKLLSTLSRWENEEPGFSLYELRLCISPTGPSTTRYCHFRLCDDSFDHNAHQVRTVRKLILEGPEVFSQDWGVLHLGSAWKIARFFPALKAFDLRSGDSEKLDVEARKASRFAFGEGLSHLPSGLEDFALDMSEYHGHSNQSLNPACVCPDATPTLDIFSIELRQFSQRLVRCCLRVGQVSASLFWPQDLLDDAAAAPDGKVPCWPVLEWFQLHTNVDNAQGEWVFTGEDPTASNPPDSDEESEQPENKSNRFRDTPCVEYFNTFHYSVALAATKQMPRLRWLKIRFQNPCSRDPYRGYIFTYTDGLATRAGAEAWTDTGNPRIEWAGDILYDPEDRVKQLWRDKAGSRLEVDVVEYRDLQPGWRRRRRLGIPEEGPLGWLRFRNGVMIEWDDGGRMIWGDCA